MTVGAEMQERLSDGFTSRPQAVNQTQDIRAKGGTHTDSRTGGFMSKVLNPRFLSTGSECFQPLSHLKALCPQGSLFRSFPQQNLF
jgi:hypothetical protein